MKRRDFLSGATAAAGLVAAQDLLGTGASATSQETAQVPGQIPAQVPLGETRQGDMLYRTLGRTSEKISALGLGGFHIGIPPEEAEGVRLIRSAIDRGVTFLDNCWDYNGGDSEVRMGKALLDGYRQKVFLMTKIDGRPKAAATRQIDESLRRLQTDVVDLMQIHEVIRLEDTDRCFGRNCTIEALLEAKRAGKIRYIGFTGHKDPLVHLRMLEVAAEHGFRFDAVQMPLNPLDAHFRSFEKQVLPVLVREGIGVLAMKTLASGAILQTRTVTAIECLHYALNLPTSTVITGMESMEKLDQGLEAIRTFAPQSEAQVQALLARTAEVARTGRYERFKTGAVFDGTARNPQWMG